MREGIKLAKVKLQVYRGTCGPNHVDFRGDQWLGDGTTPQDEHRTITQIVTEDETIIDLAVSTGPQINALFDKFSDQEPAVFGEIASVLGLEGAGEVHLGVRVYDDDK